MTNDQIGKLLEDKNLKNVPVKVNFKTRQPIVGMFITTADYADLKSKNFWRFVGEANMERYQQSKDLKLARIFNGVEITKLSAL